MGVYDVQGPMARGRKHGMNHPIHPHRSGQAMRTLTERQMRINEAVGATKITRENSRTGVFGVEWKGTSRREGCENQGNSYLCVFN